MAALASPLCTARHCSRTRDVHFLPNGKKRTKETFIRGAPLMYPPAEWPHPHELCHLSCQSFVLSSTPLRAGTAAQLSLRESALRDALSGASEFIEAPWHRWCVAFPAGRGRGTTQWWMRWAGAHRPLIRPSGTFPRWGKALTCAPLPPGAQTFDSLSGDSKGAHPFCRFKGWDHQGKGKSKSPSLICSLRTFCQHRKCGSRHRRRKEQGGEVNAPLVLQ